METQTVKDYTLVQRMMRSKAWRIPATGVGFGLFGIGGVLLSLTVFPLMYVLPISARKKERISRLSISKVWRGYVAILRWLGLISYEFHNVEALTEPNQLIIANHPSLLDVVFIIGLTGDASCIVKASLWKNPFTGFAVRAANYVSNGESRLFALCIEMLAAGQSLIVFPEGTRTKPGEPLSFHRGPSNLALSSGLPITPVVILCEPATLVKNRQWYEVSDEPAHYTITVMPKMPVAHYLDDGQFQSTAARQLTRELTSYFSGFTGNPLKVAKR